jgi:transcriptional regulator with GAF, ATPase, and Fis domain
VIYSNDTELDEAFKSSLSVQTNKIHSLLCAPIVFREGALGAVYLDSRLRTNLFDAAQRKFLKAMVDILGAVLEGGHLLTRLEEENRALRSRSVPSLDAIIWQSPEMGSMLARLQKAAPVDIAVLIEGESGTGKELLARAIHELSPRRDKPYLALDCGALAETLLESELFGHVKGAFTDAKVDKPGLFEAAAGGTVFLDEIANASKAVQARLLRVLEAREVRRIGESKTRKVDVRLICAASISLEEEIQHGRFRRDLYFRIKEMKIVVPPLRERGRDINLLAEHFKTVYAKQFGKTGLRFTPDARRRLVNYPWPGNVRELENAVKTAVVLSGGEAITPACLELPEDIGTVTGHQSLRDMMNRQEKAAIEKALQQNGYNVTATAKILKLTRQGLQKKMKQLGIS